MSETCVIIGAGQAGAQAAHSLRQGGYEGGIVMLGDEAHPPYQRPPLSKKYLSGEFEAERLWLRPEEFYDTHKIDLRVSTPVGEIDRAAREVVCVNGERIAYDTLLITTGTRPRNLPLPGFDLPGVLPLRTLADVDRLREVLERPCRIAIVGGGYIGLEVAAVARQLGHEVTVLESQERVLNRVVAPALSLFFQKLHADHGVDIRFGVTVEAVEGEDKAQAVRLGSGARIECDLVLVAVGAVPNVELAQAAGLEVDNGICVDASCRTSDPAIYAAGDCTSFPAARYGRTIRLESVQNAIDQAKAAASAILGNEVVYDPVPWFWSDQYDVKLQIAGLSQFHDETKLVGDPDSGSFYIAYLRDGRLLSVDSVSHPRSHMMARRSLGEVWRDDLLPPA
ncbi:FAD-dependent oxidoreductase [Breoghania sp.]|uniref:NAD(P)/FAD-dependent oxidoreductase n=1 Tax=Breoghania sp. TaxID=2065378 RepID=UPI002AA83339|nr:FAD-dependent oxidoreductase [Breoghania sp.]